MQNAEVFVERDNKIDKFAVDCSLHGKLAGVAGEIGRSSKMLQNTPSNVFEFSLGDASDWPVSQFCPLWIFLFDGEYFKYPREVEKNVAYKYEKGKCIINWTLRGLGLNPRRTLCSHGNSMVSEHLLNNYLFHRPLFTYFIVTIIYFYISNYYCLYYFR